jgi:glycosyltransferase involved in cell wall biosynthesis
MLTEPPTRAAPAAAAPDATAVTRSSRARVFALASGDSYTACFNGALRALGVEVLDADWSGRWLTERVRRGDILHLHWPSFLYTVPGSRLRSWWGLLRFTGLMLLLRARGARIVWTAHNLYPHDQGRTPLNRLGRRIVVWLCSYVCVHVPAAAVRVQREFRVRAAALVLLEHGNFIGFYPNTITPAAARARLDIPQGEFVYLFVGLCKPYKNLELLIRSYAALADDSQLWIVGHFQSAAYRERVQHAAALAGGGRIRIVDRFVPEDELQLYLNACDAVVLPYQEILTSGTALLALSFGRPVVAPRLGVLPEVVSSECGVLYDPLATAGLSAALRTARERRFDAGTIRQQAEQFSWERSAATFVRTTLPPAGR